eukprot:12245-Eustigmatos_ZCMA.PRE.1
MMRFVEIAALWHQNHMRPLGCHQDDTREKRRLNKASKYYSAQLRGDDYRQRRALKRFHRQQPVL